MAKNLAPLGTVIPRESVSVMPMLRPDVPNFTYNPHMGPLGLTLAALSAGLVVGDRMITPNGCYVIAPTGGGNRTPGGAWVTRL